VLVSGFNANIIKVEYPVIVRAGKPVLDLLEELYKDNSPLAAIVVVLTTASCSKKNYSQLPAYQFKSDKGTPNYHDLDYWAAHPSKWDPSDSIPAPLRKQSKSESQVDVFFIHPTTFTDKTSLLPNAPIDDATINSKTDYSAILYQASTFNETCRVFAPRYRQAHYGNYFTPDTARANKAFELAYQDVKAAFEAYLQQTDGGRPIIIASHSQGTNHAMRLLKEFFDGKPLQNKLVAAYLVGMPLPQQYFSNIPECKNELATGCVTSWRTFKKGFQGSEFVQKETFEAIVTNPLTWTTTEAFASAKENKGAVLKKFNKIKKEVTDAQVHNNMLWSSKPKFFGSFLIRSENYHIGDINLFYVNIRENVQKRIGQFRSDN
jgi:hypothetical protein